MDKVVRDVVWLGLKLQHGHPWVGRISQTWSSSLRSEGSESHIGFSSLGESALRR